MKDIMSMMVSLILMIGLVYTQCVHVKLNVLNSPEAALHMSLDNKGVSKNNYLFAHIFIYMYIKVINLFILHICSLNTSI